MVGPGFAAEVSAAAEVSNVSVAEGFATTNYLGVRYQITSVLQVGRVSEVSGHLFVKPRGQLALDMD